MAQELTPELQQLLRQVQTQLQQLEIPLTITLTPETLDHKPLIDTFPSRLLEDFKFPIHTPFEDIIYPVPFDHFSHTLSLCYTLSRGSRLNQRKRLIIYFELGLLLNKHLTDDNHKALQKKLKWTTDQFRHKKLIAYRVWKLYSSTDPGYIKQAQTVTVNALQQLSTQSFNDLVSTLQPPPLIPSPLEVPTFESALSFDNFFDM